MAFDDVGLSKHLKGRSVPRVSTSRFLDQKNFAVFPVSRQLLNLESVYKQ